MCGEISWTAELRSLACDPSSRERASEAGRSGDTQGFSLPSHSLKPLASPDGALFLACLVLKGKREWGRVGLESEEPQI